MRKVVYLYHIADKVDETIKRDRYIHRKLKTILDMRDLNQEFCILCVYDAKSGVTFVI